MITPPRRTLDTFVTPVVGFIGDDNAGKQFLATRFRVDSNAYGGAPEYDPSDSVRLQNIVRFLHDIGDMLQYMNTQWWASDNAESIRRERRALFDAHHSEEYRTGRGMFDQQGNRASPAFVAAAQQDLITLTLETLARDPVANATMWQREVFRDTLQQLEEAVTARAWVQAVDSIEMVRRPLKPVLLALSLPQSAESPTPHDDTSPSQMPEVQILAAAAAETASTTDTPGPANVGFAHRPSPPPIEEGPSIFQYPPSSSRAGLQAATGELGSSIWSDAPV